MNKTHTSLNRLEILDLSRGFAILLMFIYHFSYDLNYFNFIQTDFSQNQLWISFRTLIVTLFLTIVGISLYLAAHRGLNWKRFRNRLILLVCYSILVSFSSWIMFPQHMIFFGILHFIAISSLAGLFFTRFAIANLFLGIALIIIAQIINHPFFDHPFLQWFGLMSHRPNTVDYVPMLPWFGVVLIGMFIGQKITQLNKNSFLVCWQAKHPLNKLLIFSGRHSLHIYMLHQPLFLGILYIIGKLVK